ncbi:hypothetical protein CJ030_MR0G008965 [Morella rubra]|uniref:Uncharacterized protein n=1 Tax=Morella rubra TaxID=262757 RepID=A0A6A1UJE9_9ROSI|nr:hypothetical protein CJ030_MR0G008965 [Morella rubra]
MECFPSNLSWCVHRTVPMEGECDAQPYLWGLNSGRICGHLMGIISRGLSKWRGHMFIILIEHFHYWMPKVAPLTAPLAPWILDLPIEPVVTTPANGVIDLTGTNDDP